MKYHVTGRNEIYTLDHLRSMCDNLKQNSPGINEKVLKHWHKKKLKILFKGDLIFALSEKEIGEPEYVLANDEICLTT